MEPRRDQLGDESNDSSVADPETEGDTVTHRCCVSNLLVHECMSVSVRRHVDAISSSGSSTCSSSK